MRPFIISAVIVSCFFVLGAMFSEQLWAWHHWRFLSIPALVFCLLLVLSLAVGLAVSSKKASAELSTKVETILTMLFWSTPIWAAMFAYATPIVEDVYGDAIFFKKELDVLVNEWDLEMTKNALAYRPLDSKTGSNTFYALTSLWSWLFQVESIRTVKPFYALLASVFSLLWVMLVNRSVQGAFLKFSMAMMGILTPVCLVFHEHYELYAIPLTASMGFALSLHRFFSDPSKKRLLVLLLVFILCTKTHVFSWIFSPALLLATLHLLLPKVPILAKALEARVAIPLSIIIGVVFLGSVYALSDLAYGSRTFTDENYTEAAFLPIIASDGPPWNRYGLFSFVHVYEYLQLILSWSPVFVMLVFGSILKRSDFGKVNGFSMVVGVIIIAFVLSLFIFNPLLSLTADWDVFSLAAVFVMALTLRIAAQLEGSINSKNLAWAILLVNAFSLPFFLINSNASSLSARYEVLGRHDFKHFWDGSSTKFEASFLLEDDTKTLIDRQLTIIQDLEEYAIKGVDAEYAELLRLNGTVYRATGDLEKAYNLHKRAFEYEPELRQNIYGLVLICAELGKFQEASGYLNRLVQFQVPTKRAALMTAIQMSLLGNDIEGARGFAHQAITQFPEDQVIKEINWSLNSSNPIGALQFFQ